MESITKSDPHFKNQSMSDSQYQISFLNLDGGNNYAEILENVPKE